MSESSFSKPLVVTSREAVRTAICEARRGGSSVGLVPTMGALHDGHLSLVRAARQECDFTATTIFVNPNQFAPGEDHDNYPRDFATDLATLRDEGVDLVFGPSPEEIYPAGFSTCVEPPHVAHAFEGVCRPNHFRGVATIVLKLINLIPADFAYFGQKDYQQSLVIRRMIEDFDLSVKIRLCPTIREQDGLAMSSRNRYLSAAEREQAVALSTSLSDAVQQFRSGERNAGILANAMQHCLASAGIEEIDYAAVADAETLEVLDFINRPAIALVAARVGNTRLIDNMLLNDG